MLLDFQMPKMNGIEVLQKMRNFCKNYYIESDFKKVKIEEPTYVFLTAFSSHTFKSHIKSLGVELYFEKPL